MDANTISISLELRLADDALSGRASAAAGRRRDFVGWLGLMAAIDALLPGGAQAAAPGAVNPQEESMSIDFAPRTLPSGGAFLAPGDTGYDAARQAFNLTVDQRPALIAFPRHEVDVMAVVQYARSEGLQVATQRTGHNAGPLAPSLEDAVLLKTSAMKGAEIDPVERKARVRAGAQWMDVSDPASEHGLAALCGSARDIGIVGYSLGGGLGFLGRKHGLQANSVTAIELVTADGELIRVDHDNEVELFWALRGGGGNFGVVTAMEFDLYEAPEIYAGALFFPYEQSSEAFHAWREWTATAPEEITTTIRMLRFPPLPELPDFLRGQAYALVDGAFLGSEADGAEILKPLRDLGPVIDTFAMVPPAALGYLHMDPDQPAPFTSDHAMLRDLPAQAIDELIAAVGPGTGDAVDIVELRHLGGALGRGGDGNGALAKFDDPYLMFAGTILMDEARHAPARAGFDRLITAMAPWQGGRYFNFVEEPIDLARVYDADTYARLRAVKAGVDPDELFLANHQIPA
ncbi:MAG TPA: FAD-binding oxidoreductase [Thermoleophilaceae bacterium]|jgi:FAD/FMN-containing dehydrogenase